jgi:hypothetical protein
MRTVLGAFRLAWIPNEVPRYNRSKSLHGCNPLLLRPTTAVKPRCKPLRSVVAIVQCLLTLPRLLWGVRMPKRPSGFQQVYKSVTIINTNDCDTVVNAVVLNFAF